MTRQPRSYAFRQSVKRRMANIMTREDAKSRGLYSYFDGTRCPAGHLSPRYIDGDRCVHCVRNKDRKLHMQRLT